MRNYDFEKNISDRILENVRRLSEKVSGDIVAYSKKIAESSIEANPKLVKKYLDGHSALADIVLYAKNKSEFEIDDRIVGEWIVYLLNEERAKAIKSRRQSHKDAIINDDER